MFCDITFYRTLKEFSSTMWKFKGKKNCDTVSQRKIHKLYFEKMILPFLKFSKHCAEEIMTTNSASAGI